jgi:O-antigen/teichoic acid export membrane protein
MILLNVIIKPVWVFGIDRQVQVVVGAEVYGKYFSLFSLSLIFNILLDLGITNFANRNIAQQADQLQKLSSNGLIAKLILSFAYTIILFFIAISSGITDFKLLFLLIALQVLTSFLLFARGIVSALQLFKTDAILSIIDKGLMIIIAGLWLYTPIFNRTFTVNDFASLQVLTVGFTLLISIGVLLKRKVFQQFSADVSGVFTIVIQSLPFALTVFFMGLHNRTDAFLLERVHSNGAYEAGVYAAAYRLLDAANMLGYLFATVLVSYWSKHINDRENTQKSLSFSHQLLIPAGLLLAVLALFLNKELYQLLYHHEAAYAEEILKWCLITIIPYFITHIYGTMLTASGNIKTLMWLVIVASAINLLINAVAIPGWGATACVIAGMISQGTLAILTVIMVKKKTGYSVDVQVWLKYLIIIIVLAVSLFFIGKTSISIFTKLGIIILEWFIVMNLLRIFSVRSFLNLMREK